MSSSSSQYFLYNGLLGVGFLQVTVLKASCKIFTKPEDFLELYLGNSTRNSITTHLPNVYQQLLPISESMYHYQM